MKAHDADHEALIEAVQAGTEVEFVNGLLAAAWDKGHIHADESENPYR